MAKDTIVHVGRFLDRDDPPPYVGERFTAPDPDTKDLYYLEVMEFWRTYSKGRAVAYTVKARWLRTEKRR